MSEITVNLTELNKHVADIGAIGVLLYLRLAALADSDRRVRIGAKQLADMMGRSRTSIFNYINRLEKSGVLLRISMNAGEREREENIYQLLI